MTSPLLPPGYIYTPYYCEENVYLLAESFTKDRSISDKWETYAVFLSNPSKSVALWNQKLSTPDAPVVWDYHSILLLKPKPHGELNLSFSWVIDYDTRLPMPCPARDYVVATFGSRSFQLKLDEQFQSMFRVIPAVDYLDHFASDRSHMIQDTGSQTYIHPPPSYPCIVGRLVKEKEIVNNLMDGFVSMSADRIGKVMTFGEFCDWSLIERIEL